AGKPVDLPRGYFPGNDPERAPVNIWRPYGHLLFANWLGEIYRRAWPRLGDEPVIQWALGGGQVANHDGSIGHADLLIATAGTLQTAPRSQRRQVVCARHPKPLSAFDVPASSSHEQARRTAV